MPRKGSRPLGITILAILVGLTGIINVLAGLGALGIGIVIIPLIPIIPIIAGLTWLWGILLIVIGVFGWLVAKGLWSLDKWAYSWSMVYLIISLIINFANSSFFTAAINVILMVYLYTHRKRFR